MQKKQDNKITENIHLISIFLIVFLIPVTILTGKYIFGDRSFYFISLLIILYIMIPFFMKFEGRKPSIKELVLIAVLTTLVVISRVVFCMIPEVKPMLAIIIIVGACLGEETGFMVGALAAFTSNFFFGQGPWTPWQMFAMGVIGFLAGIIFKKLKKSKKNLCIFGGITTLVIYGGIVNLSSVAIFSGVININSILAIYLTALPFDIIHMLSTVLFLYVLSEEIIEKIERVKKR